MSEQSLATSAQSSLAPASVDQKKLEDTINKMYFQGKATPEQKYIFLHAAQRTGLDPIVGQIRPVLRENKKTGEQQMAIQTSIDGYRLIAERTGVYAGNDEPVYQDTIKVKDEYRGDVECPMRASVTVWKIVSGQRCSFTACARWAEYYPGIGASGFMWRKMPFLMLAKCAEALALRKAFPADLSGIYTDDEMQQANKDDETAKKTAQAPVKTPTVAAIPVEASSEKNPTSVTTVMEFLTVCKKLGDLEKVYERACRHEWDFEDGNAISECYENMKKKLMPLPATAPAIAA